MTHTTSRLAIRLALATAIGIAVIPGCGDGVSGEPLTYSELKESLPSQALDSEALSAKSEAAKTTAENDQSKTDSQVSGQNSKVAAKTDVGLPAPQIAPSIARVKPSPKINSATGPASDTLKPPTQPESPDSVAKNPKREIKILVPDRSFRTVKPDDSLRINFDDIDLLKVVNMDPVPKDAAKYLPEWLSGLDNKRIRIRGFMIPGFQTDGLKGFFIARDTQLCCFGRDFKPYDVFPVYMKEGVTTRYIHLRPFDVTGVFHIKARIDEDEDTVKYMYTIDDAIVIER